MRSDNWPSLIVVLVLLGAAAWYVTVLFLDPASLPLSLRLGTLQQPKTVLLLGTDVVYTDLGNRTKKIDQEAFTGRSDTIMVVRLDPPRNTLGLLAIPRDTEVYVPGNGRQKINSANAIGGHNLAIATVSGFLQLPIDHYIVLNVHGLVELVNELGGVTVEIPKKMRYMDWTAKLKIDLDPGFHTLNGNQSMGFVRFRHDALGDIGRVQRQEIFLQAVLDKLRQPSSWPHIPKLVEIASKYIDTDMSVSEMMSMVAFAKFVPKKNLFLAMLPGEFAGNGNWGVTDSDVRKMVARLMGSQFVNAERRDLRVSVENASSNTHLGLAVCRLLRGRGYNVSISRRVRDEKMPLRNRTLIIAQRGNPEDAEQVQFDLGSKGDVVTASTGDIESGVTIVVGNDLLYLTGR
ncbi:MAG TPA: LCP family protein [Oculatellaceae cyanobacterium]